MSKKILASIALFTAFLLVSSIAVSASPGYDSSVFYPNNTAYNIDLQISYEERNATDNSLVSSFSATIDGNISLVSKRLQLGYAAWGAVVKGRVTVYQDNTLQTDELFDLPIPPVLAIKENSREIYLTQVMVDLIQRLQGENISDIDIKEILGQIATNQPYPGFYVYNPFYIETGHSQGDTIPYGFRNTTSGDEVIVEGTIIGDTNVNVGGKTYSSWVVRITEVEILATLQLIIGEDMENLEGIDFTLDMYYDKQSGWLMGADLSGGGTVSEGEGSEAVNITAALDGDLILIDPGNVRVGGQSLLDRLLGLPAFSTLGIDILLIFAVIIMKIRRK